VFPDAGRGIDSSEDYGDRLELRDLFPSRSSGRDDFGLIRNGGVSEAEEFDNQKWVVL
jgi:hypothetical protein